MLLLCDGSLLLAVTTFHDCYLLHTITTKAVRVVEIVVVEFDVVVVVVVVVIVVVVVGSGECP